MSLNRPTSTVKPNTLFGEMIRLQIAKVAISAVRGILKRGIAPNNLFTVGKVAIEDSRDGRNLRRCRSFAAGDELS